MSDYIGIDYGSGQANVDKATGIRFGVISQNSCDHEAVDQIMTHGTDVAFEAAKKDYLNVVIERIDHWFNEHAFVKDGTEDAKRARFEAMVKIALEQQGSDSLAEDVAEETTENWDFASVRDDMVQDATAAVDNHFGDFYESDGGLNDFLYEREGYKLTGCLHTDIFVLKSDYYTYAQFCSPCVPGAGNLDHPVDPADGAPRSYCLGHDWFEDGKAPYRIWRVEDHVEMISEIGEVTCGHCQGTGRDSLKRVAQVRQCQVTDIDLSVFDDVDMETWTFRCLRCGGTKTEKQTVETEGEVDPNFKEQNVKAPA